MAKKVIKKRFSLSKQERESIQNIQSVVGILKLLRQGMDYSLTLELAQARHRLNLGNDKTPEGYVRNVDFDSESNELVLTDSPVPEKEDKKEEKKDDNPSK